MTHPHMNAQNTSDTPPPRVIAWELTRQCNLNCRHCRGAALDKQYANELSTDECFKVIDNIAESIPPHPPTILILTGGEPMIRPDIFEIAKHASDGGLYVVMAPCGHLITPETARKLKESGVQALSISIDGSTPEKHDSFRGIKGAYEKTMIGLQHAIDVGIAFQVNTTVTKLNLADLPDIYEKVCQLGAKTFDLFFLVPTGRGETLKDLEISDKEYEKTFKWINDTAQTSPIVMKTTCAPHFARIQSQHGQGKNRHSSGCMAGRGFVFISHIGELQPCGFFDRPCGNLRENNYDFCKLYRESKIFNDLRDVDKYLGKCGICEYRRVCGGCRARAMAHSGNYMDQEPRCSYEPQQRVKGNS